MMGPWPMRDDSGFATALSMLWKSLQKGKNSKNFQQFDTIRKMRTVARNIHNGSLSGHVQVFTFSDARKKTYAMTINPTQSSWFRMFNLGCDSRMGSIVIQNSALELEVLLEILEMYEFEFWSYETTATRRRQVVMNACFLVTGYEHIASDALSFGFQPFRDEDFASDWNSICAKAK